MTVAALQRGFQQIEQQRNPGQWYYVDGTSVSTWNQPSRMTATVDSTSTTWQSVTSTSSTSSTSAIVNYATPSVTYNTTYGTPYRWEAERQAQNERWRREDESRRLSREWYNQYATHRYTFNDIVYNANPLFERLQNTPNRRVVTYGGRQADRRLDPYAHTGVSNDFLRQEERRLRALAMSAESEERAKELLTSAVLTESEAAEFAEHNRITVMGSNGGVFIVQYGWVANVVKLDTAGQPECRLCAHAAADYPTADNVSAQILAIKTGEAEFLKVANRHQLRRDDLELVAA